MCWTSLYINKHKSHGTYRHLIGQQQQTKKMCNGFKENGTLIVRLYFMYVLILTNETVVDK